MTSLLEMDCFGSVYILTFGQQKKACFDFLCLLIKRQSCRHTETVIAVQIN